MAVEEMKYAVVNDVSSKLVHISPSGNLWSVRMDSSQRARRLLKDRRQALDYVKPLQMKGFKVAVHKKNGVVDFMIDSNGKKY